MQYVLRLLLEFYVTEIIRAVNSSSRFLDALSNVDNPCSKGMVGRIFPSELQLNKANASDTEAPFSDLHLN